MDHQQFIVYYGEVVAKNWSSLLIEVTISRRLFVVMPENGIFCEFNFSNGILWEFSRFLLCHSVGIFFLIYSCNSYRLHNLDHWFGRGVVFVRHV